jgi:hypothetical protein
MKDPQRLHEQTELPDALHEALRGLGRSAPPAAAVARIQRSLSALPASHGPAGGSPSAAASGWSVGAFKLAAVAFSALAAAIVATVALRAGTPSDAPAPHAARAAATSADVLRVAAETETAIVATEAPVIEHAASSAHVARDEVSANEPVRGHRVREDVPPRPVQRAHRSEPGAAPRPTGNDAVAAQGPAVEPEAALPESPRPAQQAHDAQHAAPEAPHAQAKPQPPHRDLQADLAAGQAVHVEPRRGQAPEDEAGLLYRAKKLARTDRRAALHMLEQHAAYFPQGTLVEEREVLAIDLLQRLGQKTEAAQRSALFLERFPHSSYRSAITH